MVRILWPSSGGDKVTSRAPYTSLTCRGLIFPTMEVPDMMIVSIGKYMYNIHPGGLKTARAFSRFPFGHVANSR